MSINEAVETKTAQLKRYTIEAKIKRISGLPIPIQGVLPAAQGPTHPELGLSTNRKGI